MKRYNYLVVAACAILLLTACIKGSSKKCHKYPLNTETLCTDFITELGDSMWYCEKVTLDQRDVTDSVLAIAGGALSFVRTRDLSTDLTDKSIFYYYILVYGSKGSVRLYTGTFYSLQGFPEILNFNGLPFDTTTPKLGDSLHPYPIFDCSPCNLSIQKLQKLNDGSQKRQLILNSFDSVANAMYTFSFSTK
jgi:hypothetical protein